MRKFVKGFLLFCSLILASCDFSGGNISNDTTISINNSIDLEVYTPNSNLESDENTYYISKQLVLVTSINGSFKVDRPFTLDENDENKRIYDNLYFYEKDYFWMDVRDSFDLNDMFYELSDPTDTQYVDVNSEAGRLDIKKGQSGIYKVIFDISTLKFDLEFKSEIVTPVYETIENCSLYTTSTHWVEMKINSANEDEFILENFSVASKTRISFFSNIHTSNYKITVDENYKDKWISQSQNDAIINIGGNYNIYINAKTYVVRADLLNPLSADYNCMIVENGEFINLEAESDETPYIFSMQVSGKKYGVVPDSFYSVGYMKYNLSFNDSELIMGDTYKLFKQDGTYKIVVNLLTFKIDVLMLGE